MNIPKNAVDLATAFEGYYPTPYLCPAGVPTIGNGSTIYPNGVKVKLTDPPITEEIAYEIMEWELSKAMAATIKYCPILLTTSETWLGAIIDFVYNLGAGRLQASTLRREINSESWESVPDELNKWVFAGGRKLKGLVLRRAAEASFFQ